jgi:hypothetical protein
MMSLKLPEVIRSSQDLKTVIMELHAYVSWYRNASIKYQVAPTSKPPEPPVVSQEAVSLLDSLSQQKTLQPEYIEALIAQLNIVFEHSPRITITFAAPASFGLQKRMTTWCREHIAPDILIEFRFSKNILGGMVVQYGSRIFDWSFRREILANRSHFPEVLRRV